MNKQNIAAIYPLTPTQEGLLFHTLDAPGQGAYVEQVVVQLTGPLDAAAWRAAWTRVVADNDVLRTLFSWERRSRPLQIVRRQVALPWAAFDWQALPAEEQEAQFAAWLAADRRRGFDLEQAPLLRLTLFARAHEHHTFVWSFHHILADGWSTALILRDVLTAYGALRDGLDPQPPRRPRFQEFVAWRQAQPLDAAFWRSQLAGCGEPTRLPLPRPAAAQDGYRMVTRHLGQPETAALQDAVRAQRLTLNTVLQGAWALLLGRYGNRQDVVFGTTSAGRPAALSGAEQMVGLFINTLPLRVRIDEAQPVAAWLQALQLQLAELRQQEHTPLVEAIRLAGLPGGSALFDSLVVFENYPYDPHEALGADGVTAADISYREQSHYPLSLIVVPGAALQLTASYDRALFADAAVARLLDHLANLLTGISAALRVDPAAPLGGLPLLSAAERQTVLVDWNATQTPPAADTRIEALFAAAARAHPERLAVAAHDGTLTYGALAARAAQLSHALRGRGAAPGARIGLYAPRGVDLLVGMLAILQSGAAYVPLDPAYPAPRLRQIHDLARPLLILAPTNCHAELAALVATPCVALDADWPAWPETPPPVAGTAADPAYVIFTSGSSGTPKGVVVSQRNLVHSTSARFAFYADQPDSFLLLSSYAFDSSVAGIFWTLCRGGTLVLPAPDEEKDVDRLAALLRTWQVSHTLLLPSLYEILLASAPAANLASLRLVIVAGEACSAALVDRHQDVLPGCALYNEYGPTEATVWSTAARLQPGPDPLPIGRPIPNMQNYVVDSRLRPLPVGVPGELLLAGDGVADGYLDRPDLTAERFVDNPFGSGRAYRSGDLVRWRDDGQLLFLGRLDRQVKIRGNRVELEEVEAALRGVSAIQDAAVVARGGAQLVAYVVYRPGAALPAAQLRRALADRLPDPMVPDLFLPLPGLPRMPNGKVDRGALPAPDAALTVAAADYAPPQSDTERALADLWAELLGVGRVGREDNFFELGGHSLIVTRLVARVRAAYEIALPIRALFDAPTVAALARQVDALRWASRAPEPETNGAEREEFEF